MRPLTKRQHEVLTVIEDYIRQHGYAPSLQEIGTALGLSALATVHKHLSNLEAKGYIKRAFNRSRSMELVPRNRAWETWGTIAEQDRNPDGQPSVCIWGAKQTAIEGRDLDEKVCRVRVEVLEIIP